MLRQPTVRLAGPVPTLVLQSPPELQVTLVTPAAPKRTPPAPDVNGVPFRRLEPARDARLRLLLAALGLLTLASAAWAGPTSLPRSDHNTPDPTCSHAGYRSTIDRLDRCVCQAGYSGPSCGTCAVGFERDASGACVLGAAARRDVCYDKGTPYLDPYGGIACQCDAGLTGPDCGGPDIKIEGAGRSVNAGDTVVLRAKGGSGSYKWSLVTPRGTLLAGGRGGRRRSTSHRQT